MQYSPKLKRISAQIQQILKDNDVAGYFVIHTCTPEGAGFSEFAVEITPSYSAVEFNAAKDRVSIKGKLEHYNGDAKKQNQRLTQTLNMLEHLSVRTMEDGMMLAHVADKASQAYNATHSGDNLSSKQSQDN